MNRCFFLISVLAFSAPANANTVCLLETVVDALDPNVDASRVQRLTYAIAAARPAGRSTWNSIRWSVGNIGQQTPTAADLVGCDAVVVAGFHPIFDGEALGDALTAYAEVGGRLLLTGAAVSTDPVRGLRGRAAAEQLSPIVGADRCEYGLPAPMTIRALDRRHPLFDGYRINSNFDAGTRATRTCTPTPSQAARVLGTLGFTDNVAVPGQLFAAEQDFGAGHVLALDYVPLDAGELINSWPHNLADLSLTSSAGYRLLMDGVDHLLGVLPGECLAHDLELGSVVGSIDGNTCSGDSNDVYPSCAPPVSETGVPSSNALDLTYRWTAPETAAYDFTVTGGFNALVTVHRDPCALELACNDVDELTEAAARRVQVTQGESLLLSVDSTGTTCGDLQLGISCSYDADADGICDEVEICGGDPATGDADGDFICDDLDLCTGTDSTGDFDLDGVCDDLDACHPFDVDLPSEPFVSVSGTLETQDNTYGPPSLPAPDPHGNDIVYRWRAPVSDTYTFTVVRPTRGNADQLCLRAGCDAVDTNLTCAAPYEPSGRPDPTRQRFVAAGDIIRIVIDNVRYESRDDTFTLTIACPDTDGDLVCDGADPCHGDNATGDADLDLICDDLDLCMGDDASGDADADGLCDDLDPCLGDEATGDSDVDGVCDDADQCLGDDASGDSDFDGVCNDLDACPAVDVILGPVVPVIHAGSIDRRSRRYEPCADDSVREQSILWTAPYAASYRVQLRGWSGHRLFVGTACDGLPEELHCSDRESRRTDLTYFLQEAESLLFVVNNEAVRADQSSPPREFDLEITCVHDVDGNGKCDEAQACVGDEATGDPDADGICLDRDVCLGDDASGDSDGDLVCDDLDACAGDDATGDADMDGVCDDLDVCDGDDATGDSDGDGLCADVDSCDGDNATGDSDSDGVCDNLDACAGDDATGDVDNDGVCDDVDLCEGDALTGDDDGDALCNDLDTCALPGCAPCEGRDGDGDSDGDGICEDRDQCDGDDAIGDADGDGLCDDLDPCFGDQTTDDWDRDGICNSHDICIAAASGRVTGPLPATLASSSACTSAATDAGCGVDTIDYAGAIDHESIVRFRAPTHGLYRFSVQTPHDGNTDTYVSLYEGLCGVSGDPLVCEADPSDTTVVEQFFEAGAEVAIVTERTGDCNAYNLTISCVNDVDGDGVCDEGQLCLGNDSFGDADGDGVCDEPDLCAGDDLSGDDDEDGVCNDLDPCVGLGIVDSDSDGLCDTNDLCFGDNATGDGDQDAVCDDLDTCLGDDASGDADGDGICDDTDICPASLFNLDADGDGICDDVDSCLGDNSTGDTDNDGTCDDLDVCNGGNDGVVDTYLGNALGSWAATTCGGEDDYQSLCLPPGSTHDEDRTYEWYAPFSGNFTFRLLNPTGPSVVTLRENLVCRGDEIQCDYGLSGGQITRFFPEGASAWFTIDGHDTCGDYVFEIVCNDDADGDGVCNPIDQCVGEDAVGDADGDGVCDDLDACVGDDGTGDSDGDAICDDLDTCIGDDASGDADTDGYCDLDVAGLPEDCQPGDGQSYPGADEPCDGVDNDCDGAIDEGNADLDNDGICDGIDLDRDADGCPNALDRDPDVSGAASGVPDPASETVVTGTSGPGPTGVVMDGTSAVVTSNGRAWFLERTAGWSEVFTTTSPGGTRFGTSAAIRGDLAAIAATENHPQRGRVWLYERSAGTWSLSGQLPTPAWDGNERALGTSMALGDDLLAVGAPIGDNGGVVHVMHRETDGSWTQEATLKGVEQFDSGDTGLYLGDAYFGLSVALDGNTLAVGAPGSVGDPAHNAGGDRVGAVFMFERQPDASWVQVAIVMASDPSGSESFGTNLALSGDDLLVREGDVFGIGVFSDVHQYRRVAGSWGFVRSWLHSSTQLGDGLAIEDGLAWLSDGEYGNVAGYDLQTGATISTLDPTSASAGDKGGLAIEGGHLLLVGEDMIDVALAFTPGGRSLADDDMDGLPDDCDLCLDDDTNDSDGDGLCDIDDLCPNDPRDSYEFSASLSGPLEGATVQTCTTGDDFSLACLGEGGAGTPDHAVQWTPPYSAAWRLSVHPDNILHVTVPDGCAHDRIACTLGDSVVVTAGPLTPLVYITEHRQGCGVTRVSIECAFDSDGDTVCDEVDVCAGGDDAFDADGDGTPDGCDLCAGDHLLGDSDFDGVCDDIDLCAGDDATGDPDGDNVCTDLDPCPLAALDDQDSDGVCDDLDGCPLVPGGDADGDGVCDVDDLCDGDDALDDDSDGIPDACDLCPGDPGNDDDSDGVCAAVDLCLGDDATGDSDGDRICDELDLCEGDDAAGDDDGDGVCGDMDPCPLDPLDDSDGDGVCDSDDQCPGEDDLDDLDADGLPDICDACPSSATGDTDGDGVCDDVDLCQGGDDAADADGDGVCDLFDICVGDDAADFDGDGVPNACDACPLSASGDSDGDGVCDDADRCPGQPDADDIDSDGTPDGCDVCPNFPDVPDVELASDIGRLVLASTCGAGDDVADPQSAEDRIYRWTAPADTTYGVDVPADTIVAAFRCGQAAPLGVSSGGHLDLTLAEGDIVRFVVQTTPTCGEFTLDIGCADADGDGVCNPVDVCYLDDAFGDLDADGICDLQLIAPLFERGQPVTLTARNAGPGTTVFFFVSPAEGNGPCAPPAFGEACLGLRQPIRLGSAVADASGVARLSLTVPPAAPAGGDIYLQAAWVSAGRSEASAVVAGAVAP